MALESPKTDCTLGNMEENCQKESPYKDLFKGFSFVNESLENKIL